ncbi:MAG: hypothetical protein ACOYMF_05825 [Bacteroidales bacterium]
MKLRQLLFLMSAIAFCGCSSSGQKNQGKNDSVVSDSSRLYENSFTLAIELPEWAKQLGLVEPRNMVLIPGKSHMTSADEHDEAFNSVTLMYTGNYDTAMNQARFISQTAKLPLSKDYKAMRKQAEREGRGSRFKGIAYMNYDLSTRDIEFLVYVIVDDKGNLTISATDMKQMNEQLSKHEGVANRLKKSEK